MEKCEIIAEVGLLHNGEIEKAFKLVETAAECGADVVKFQTHIPESETLVDAPAPTYFKDEPRYEYFKRTGFNINEWEKIHEKCKGKNIEFMSSVFSIESVKLLEKIGIKRYKIPSGEVTNIPLLEYVSKLKKPIILSSGMTNWEELDEAVNTIAKNNEKLTILQCTSAYPAKYEEIGLNVMLEMKERYKKPVGLSDHSLTNYSSYAAATLGATIIEKHLTASKKWYGSDAKHSLEPKDFTELVKGIRAINKMIDNKVDKNDIKKFKDMRKIFQKSVVSLVDIPKGTQIEEDMISTKKPGVGLEPKYFRDIIGKKVRKDIKKDSTILKSDIDW